MVLWALEPETVGDIQENHRNEVYLPGISLDPAIAATAQLDEVATCDVLLLTTPAQHARKIAGALVPHLKNGQILVVCSKGIEQSSGKLISQVVAEVAPGSRIAVLSGPSFATEVARGLPAAVTLASDDEDLGRDLSYALSHLPFRCYWSDDVLGVEIGGAVKNVYAIAAGIVAGRKLGSSAHAALVTRRMRPLEIAGRTVHQIAIPFHWGSSGPVRGDIANDLIPLTGEPNVSIHEAKALTCALYRGRRPPDTSYVHWLNRMSQPGSATARTARTRPDTITSRSAGSSDF